MCKDPLFCLGRCAKCLLDSALEKLFSKLPLLRDLFGRHISVVEDYEESYGVWVVRPDGSGYWYSLYGEITPLILSYTEAERVMCNLTLPLTLDGLQYEVRSFFSLGETSWN